jgi:hypothetical protein
MKRVVKVCALALPIVMLGAAMVSADVKTRDRSQLKFESRVLNFFMGKAAKEGLESTVAVKGSRKATINDVTGQIVDLAEEKVYELDVHKKTYTVKTFEQIRQELREKAEEARKNAEKQQPREEKSQPAGQQKEYEVDFDVKETGQHKQIAGYDTHEAIVTVTVREKGKTLEDAGGLVMTTDTWLGPQIPQLKEIADFDMKYWRAIQGPEAVGMTAQQMAAVIAMYPQVKSAMERMQKEGGGKLQGFPLATLMTFEGVKSKDQMAQESQSGGGGGGIGGMLARKMAKKGDDKPRATIFTINHEVLEVATAASPADVAIPAGFTEKK